MVCLHTDTMGVHPACILFDGQGYSPPRPGIPPETTPPILHILPLIAHQLASARQNLHDPQIRRVGCRVSKNTHAVRRPSAWATRGSASYTELLKRLRTIPTYSVYGKIARLLRASQEPGLFLMTQAQSRWACFARTEHH